MTNRLKKVEVIKPPITTMAIGARKLGSAPKPSAMGSMPAPMANRKLQPNSLEVSASPMSIFTKTGGNWNRLDNAAPRPINNSCESFYSGCSRAEKASRDVYGTSPLHRIALRRDSMRGLTPLFRHPHLGITDTRWRFTRHGVAQVPESDQPVVGALIYIPV